MPPAVAMGRVIRNDQEGPGCFRLRVQCAPVLEGAHPGQFLNVRVGDGYHPLLRRPFSFCEMDPGAGEFSVLYQVMGAGTARLSQARPGAQLSFVGPLGRGFRTESPTRFSIVCAGGIGVAPFPAVARALVDRSQVQAVIGARTATLCLCQEDFRSLGIPVRLATEDGSAGVRGFVTEPLREAIEYSGPHETTIYACGPEPMLAAVADLCQEYRCPAQLSVEAVMGCGVGACLSCVFRTPDGRYIRSCVEGPVFHVGEVLF